MIKSKTKVNHEMNKFITHMWSYNGAVKMTSLSLRLKKNMWMFILYIAALKALSANSRILFF